MRAALYIRVSTEEQAREGFSIAAQKERLEAYVKSQGWELVSYYVDEGRSAKDTNRPELKRMIKNIEEGIIDVVLVYRLDRLTRSVLDLYQLLETFENNGCKFKSATEVYDTTTAIGRLFITLVAALAQWERENLGERVRMGMGQKVREGGWHGSTPPFGYNLDEGELIVNEDEAKYVRWMYSWYLEGLSDRKIAIRLNDMGTETKTGSGIWREARIRYILTNPLYIGNLRWGVRVNQENAFEVENAAPSIIDKETYEQVQKVREGRRDVHPRQATSPYIFSGSLRCSRCGAGMKGHKSSSKEGKPRYSYRCINRYEHRCDMPMISERIIESTFLQYFNYIPDATEQPTTKEQKDNLHEIERLEKELVDIKRRRKKWQYAWANNLMKDDEYKERMNEEQSLEDEIQSELSKISNVKEELPPEHVGIVGKYIEENWENLTREEKKIFVQNTIERIVVEKVKASKRKERAKIVEISFK